MMGASLLIIIVIVSWLLVFLTRRRFGVLGLGLTAGYLLSTFWSGQVSEFVQGIDAVTISLGSGLMAVILVLLPAFALLLSGPTYSKKRSRALGASLFTLMALALVAGPLSGVIDLSSFDQSVFSLIEQYRILIVTGGIIVAIIDILGARSPRRRR